MKCKVVLAAVISLIFLITPHYASAQRIDAKYYGYGDIIRLTSTTPTELLSLSLNKGETTLVCHIQATGYVNVEDAKAVFMVSIQE